MYVKRHAVRRGEKRYVYLRLVESYRDQRGKVRHRVLKTLGREDELKASGQLDQLQGSFARLDPPLAGIRREVGPLLLVRHFTAALGIGAAVDRLVPQRGRHKLSTGEVVVALIASRLASPSPLYDVAGWASGAAISELFAIPHQLLNDDRLGRCLEALCPHAEQLRGAVMLRAIERFGIDAARLHLDLTALRLAGAYEDSALVEKGWSADRRVARQIRALQATSAAGVPLYSRPGAGSAAELTMIGQGLERLRELLPEGLLVVADSALGNVKPLCEADRAGLRFIVPLRAVTGFRERFLAEVGSDALRPLRYASARELRLAPAERTRYRGILRPFEVTDPETGELRRLRVAYVHSSEEAREVAAARERALAKAEDALGRIERGLGGRHYRTKAQVDRRLARVLAPVEGLIEAQSGERNGRPTLRFRRDQEAIERAALTDGLSALATNLAGRLSAERVLRTYKQQWVVERRHRDLKQTLRVRPIFLQNDDRIEALVSVVGLALLVFGLIEAELRERLGDEELPGLLPEGRSGPPTGRNILAAFQGLGLAYTANGIALDRLTETQRRILELLEVDVPWPEQGQLAA
ncbi:MAG: IS1634 family transposase [Solirubrobacterales bacterium]